MQQIFIELLKIQFYKNQDQSIYVEIKKKIMKKNDNKKIKSKKEKVKVNRSTKNKKSVEVVAST